ncbi:type VI secretion system tube protein TssD [Chimaeribacter arupi]|uniref:type VI secretion system tube protein TssD n=1 Tax=Chimaeribacter arupi TaxID=2060066 RepID=UPI002711EEB3|nr:type VI secretion system tube protein TssD [Chimaeribacter arupi]WKZ93645.1 type VI secretion system tube protein TssD [Chimaeribacter arupi]
MAIPVYLWLKDDGGADIHGLVDVRGRENSIEVLDIEHCIELPTDFHSGKIVANHRHEPVSFTKELDCASPYLYQALTTGRMLRSAEFRYYRINDAGQEENYFTVLLENAYVTGLHAMMYDIKSDYGERCNHLEGVELHYEKISWHYRDGNLIHSDSWDTRRTA